MADVRRESTFQPPPPPDLWEEFQWSNLTIHSEFKQKVLQYSLAAVTLVCDSQ
jgi:hypothetical protein